MVVSLRLETNNASSDLTDLIKSVKFARDVRYLLDVEIEADLAVNAQRVDGAGWDKPKWIAHPLAAIADTPEANQFGAEHLHQQI